MRLSRAIHVLRFYRFWLRMAADDKTKHTQLLVNLFVQSYSRDRTKATTSILIGTLLTR